MGTYRTIRLKSEYFEVYTSTGIGTGNSAEEMAYLREWESEHTPIMENIKEKLEREFKVIQSTLKIPLMKHSDKLRDLIYVSDEEIDPSSVSNFIRRGNGPCIYSVRFRDVQDFYELFIDIYFPTLPEWRVRESMKRTLELALKGQVIDKKPRTKRVKGMVYELHVIPSLRAPPKPVESVELTMDGIKNDFSPWRAMALNENFLLLPWETIKELNMRGWPVKPGDLQENITTQRIPYQHLLLTRRFRIGTAEIIITGSRRMDNLTYYEHGALEHLKSLHFLGDNWPEFQQAIAERLGLFALTIKEGTVRRGDPIEALSI